MGRSQGGTVTTCYEIRIDGCGPRWLRFPRGRTMAYTGCKKEAVIQRLRSDLGLQPTGDDEYDC